MCAIVGALVPGALNAQARLEINLTLAHIWERSHQRGRDGRGFVVNAGGTLGVSKDVQRADRFNCEDAPAMPENIYGPVCIVGNLRAEPTTEYVADKKLADQQPYSLAGWAIVHNGTIANDKTLRTNKVNTVIDSAAIVEHLAAQNPNLNRFNSFVHTINSLKGSFAILATHWDDPTALYVATNYRPVWYASNQHGTFFASSRDYFPSGMIPQMVRPYSAMMFRIGEEPVRRYLLGAGDNGKALVVCSGGLDSVVAAAFAKRTLGYDIHLIHFLYGSRAEGPEVEAVKAVAAELKCELTLFPLNVYSKDDSPLLDKDAAVAGGEAGAEFAHEWVPARNLLLLAVATAFAEARSIETIILGNNLEEAGAYPDNEPEFIAKFNDMLPFAVGDGKRMKVIMPVGNLMKHEIVRMGLDVGAPMHLTWSCYRAGEHHCGKCGPCFMRRTAFKINNTPEVIQYDV